MDRESFSIYFSILGNEKESANNEKIHGERAHNSLEWERFFGTELVYMMTRAEPVQPREVPRQSIERGSVQRVNEFVTSRGSNKT